MYILKNLVLTKFAKLNKSESTSKRFVADTEKASWNSKTKTVVSSTTPTGMATGDLWYQII